MTRRIKRIPPPPGHWVCEYIAVLAEAECAAGELCSAVDSFPARFRREDPELLEQLISQLLEVASGAVFAAQQVRQVMRLASAKPEKT